MLCQRFLSDIFYKASSYREKWQIRPKLLSSPCQRVRIIFECSRLYFEKPISKFEIHCKVFLRKNVHIIGSKKKFGPDKGTLWLTVLVILSVRHTISWTYSRGYYCLHKKTIKNIRNGRIINGIPIDDPVITRSVILSYGFSYSDQNL